VHDTMFTLKPDEPLRNPSRWRERLPVVLLATAGLSIASYLAAYQLGFVRKVWEPFFGAGSERVLHSFVSRLLPIPDAVAGALGYFAELITALIGGEQRWRTSPSLVLFYGAIVAALAVAGLVLSALQLFVLHAFCTLCLVSAIISLLIAWLACSEVLASLARDSQP
jgi:uncharacterized membrane protein